MSRKNRRNRTQKRHLDEKSNPNPEIGDKPPEKGDLESANESESDLESASESASVEEPEGEPEKPETPKLERETPRRED